MNYIKSRSRINLANSIQKALEVMRREIAAKERVKAFQVFHNSVLEQIALKCPLTTEDLKIIQGVGDKTVQKYGAEILKVIHKELLGQVNSSERMRKIKLLLPKMRRIKTWLRNNPTPAELRFKSLLEELNIPYKFQKGVTTHSLTRFRVLDFYIPRANIAFEVDGFHHRNKQRKVEDEKRIADIKARRSGLFFVRFSNDQILNNLEKVRQEVVKVFHARYKPKRAK